MILLLYAGQLKLSLILLLLSSSLSTSRGESTTTPNRYKSREIGRDDKNLHRFTSSVEILTCSVPTTYNNIMCSNRQIKHTYIQPSYNIILCTVTYYYYYKRFTQQASHLASTKKKIYYNITSLVFISADRVCFRLGLVAAVVIARPTNTRTGYTLLAHCLYRYYGQAPNPKVRISSSFSITTVRSLYTSHACRIIKRHNIL